MQLLPGIPYIGKRVIVDFLDFRLPAIIIAVNEDGSWMGRIEWAYA